MSIQALKEKGGFWIPNTLIDEALPTLRSVGVAVYCVLARCNSVRDYPNVAELAEICLTTVNRIDNVLDELLRLGFLNFNDVVKIRNS